VYLNEFQYAFLIMSHSILLTMRNVSDKRTELVQESKIHFLCSLNIFPKSCL